MTFGAFDLFHAGHVLMMQEAKTVCDHLIAWIQSDPTIDRPILSSFHAQEFSAATWQGR
jgi:cytidyltransferase-like protein